MIYLPDMSAWRDNYGFGSVAGIASPGAAGSAGASFDPSGSVVFSSVPVGSGGVVLSGGVSAGGVSAGGSVFSGRRVLADLDFRIQYLGRRMGGFDCACHWRGRTWLE